MRPKCGRTGVVRANRPPRSDEDEAFESAYFGIGTLHGVSDEGPPEEPSEIWLPMHRSGSRQGGWVRRPVAQHPIGFRRP